MAVRSAHPMGYFVGGFQSDDIEAICPECGGPMDEGSIRCTRCNGEIISQRQREEWEAENVPAKLERHAFYKAKMAEGWTLADVMQHAAEERKRKGDPPRPRFWSGTSIGQPKRLH